MKDELKEQKKVMEAAQLQAQQDRIEAARNLENLSRKHDSDMAQVRQDNEREQQRLRQSMEQARAEDKAHWEQRLASAAAQHEKQCKDMQDQAKKDLKEARGKGDGAASMMDKHIQG